MTFIVVVKSYMEVSNETSDIVRLSSNSVFIRQCIANRDCLFKEGHSYMYISRTLHLARIATEAVCRSYFLNGVFYWKVKQVIMQWRYEKNGHEYS